MRFLQLDLRDYGPFSNPRAIPLDGGDRGLHLIVGPNEAGKSTTLRAIRTLLFGFPQSTADRHARDYSALRIGGAIQDESGRRLDFIRRKKDVAPLWTFDDERPLSPDALLPFLGGMDLEKFRDLFSMDHAELINGGQSILKGGGRLGEMLFAAGSGLAPVTEVRKKLDEEMERLFKPRASNPAINAAITELTEKRRASEKAMLATNDWVELDATLARERAKKQANDVEIRQVEVEKRRLERLRDAWPVLKKIDGVSARLAGFGASKPLSEGFADRRRDAWAARSAGLKAAQAAEEGLEAAVRELDALGARDSILDEADAIHRVREDLGLYRKALEDRPVATGRLARLEADALGLLRELRPAASLEDASAMGISGLLKGRVQALAQELSRLEADRSNAENEVAKLVAASPGLDRTRAGIDPEAPALAEALALAIQQGQADGDLEAHLASTLAELAKLEQQAALELRRLPLWSGSLEALEALAVPSKATLTRFETAFREASEALSGLDRDLDRLEQEKARLDREIDRRQEASSVPTEEELAARRALRDQTWQAIRRAWLDGEPFEAPERSADAFEAAVRSSDELADRLRTEATAVAEHAERRWRRRELADQVAAKEEARALALQQQSILKEEWDNLWRALGLAPLPPAEMKEWVADQRADLIRQARAVREKALERDRKLARIDDLRVEIGRHLERLGEPKPGPEESLAGLLGRARATVDRVRFGSRLEEVREALAKAEAALEAGRSRWGLAVEPLGLGADATPPEALGVIARFDEVAGILKEAGELRGRLDEQRRVETRFEAAVVALKQRLGMAAIEATPEATALSLDDRLKGALVDEARRDSGLKRREAERSKLEKARTATDQAVAALGALVDEAGCGSADALVEAEQVSDAIKDARKELRSLEEQLSSLAGPVPVETLREEAGEIDPETLESRIVELADQLEPLSAKRDRLAEEIGRCRNQLEAMDGGPAAAEAQQLVEDRVAWLADAVEKYARLRLASAVLRDAVERYRKEHQGPVLDRAGGLFASLTAGSFSGLRADLDDKGVPILLGVRADGTTLLKADAMSEGTADQLYLALRLASLQTYLDSHEPMPLVVDDILVNFDNARALAALRALAELSKRTQVLFFTHHDHLVEIARGSLPDDVLFVHRLDFPPVSFPLEGSTAQPSRAKRKKKGAATLLEDETSVDEPAVRPT